MPIEIQCSCGKRLRVKDNLAGRKVKCPDCTEVISVPDNKQRHTPNRTSSVKRKRRTRPREKVQREEFPDWTDDYATDDYGDAVGDDVIDDYAEEPEYRTRKRTGSSNETFQSKFQRELKRQRRLMFTYVHEACGTECTVGGKVGDLMLMDPESGRFNNITHCPTCYEAPMSQCRVRNGQTLLEARRDLIKQLPISFWIAKYLLIPIVVGLLASCLSLVILAVCAPEVIGNNTPSYMVVVSTFVLIQIAGLNSIVIVLLRRRGWFWKPLA